MFITKKFVPRRRFLQGMGVTLALPLLDAMIPAASALQKTAAAGTKRFGAVFVPMGAVKDHWTPATTGTGFDFSTILRPLEPLRRHVAVISNVNRPIEGTHSSSVASWLSGVAPKRTEAEDVRLSKTLDQIIADHIGGTTPLASLELAIEDVTGYVGACDTGYACVYQNTMAWRSPTVAIPMETNPRVAFERLFGRPGTPGAESRQGAARFEHPRLVRADAADLNRGLGLRDQARLSQYLENIREVENRIHLAEMNSEKGLTLPETPVGIPEAFPEHAGLMFDLMALAYEADIARVATFMMAREASQKVYPEINFLEPHHHVSHHRDQAENLSRLVTLQTHFATQFARFATRLANTPDGDGSLLDHTVLMYGSGMSNSNIHSPLDIPLITVGGSALGVQGDVHHREDKALPHANVLVDIANKFDVDVKTIGISNGRYVI